MILGITGATGLLARHVLVAARADGHHVIAYSRQEGATLPNAHEVRRWEPTGPPPDVRGLDAIIHLAGESIQGRWTSAKRAAILESRVNGTRTLVTALAEQASTATLVCASGSGFYGDRGDELLEESSTPGSGFLSEVTQAWEAEARRAEPHGARTVQARLGMVLSAEGGAFPLLQRLHRLGLGGRLGHGRQWVPWVHVADAAALLLLAATNPSLRGPLNVVAPDSVTQEQFSHELAAALHRPAWLVTPAWALRVGLGEQASLLLESQRVRPLIAKQTGYVFQFPTLRQALVNVLSPT